MDSPKSPLSPFGIHLDRDTGAYSQRRHQQFNRGGASIGASVFARLVRMENMGPTDTVWPYFLGSEFTTTSLDIVFGPHLTIHVTASSSRAKRRALGKTSASIGTELTSERFSRARSLSTCPGGISRKRVQPSSWSTTVESYHGLRAQGWIEVAGMLIIFAGVAWRSAAVFAPPRKSRYRQWRPVRNLMPSGGAIGKETGGSTGAI
jgi:hypothetical protein